MAIKNPQTSLSDEPSVELLHNNSTTIAAIATGAARSGIGIIRLSGQQSKKIAEKVSRIPLTPRVAHYAKFYDQNNSVLDEGLLLYFPAPRSFTGEEVVEFHAHGSPVLLDCLLKLLVTHGAVLAKPGEFSERAFLNGKIDLTQAEAIADIISASSEHAARCAMRSLQGVFSKKIHSLVEELVTLRVFVEAAIDFPDEEIDFLPTDKIIQQLSAITKKIDSVFEEATRGRLVQEGVTIVIAGKPNAGKSSLLNQLASEELAIVTDIEGTTRDTIRHAIHIEGLPLHIVDTAGLRNTLDRVESEGVKRSLQQIDQADRILLVVDANLHKENETLESLWPSEVGRLPTLEKICLVYNKIDLVDENEKENIVNKKLGVPIVTLSAKTGSGIRELQQHIKESVGYSSSATEGQFTARRRHLYALEKTQENVHNATRFVLQKSALEIVAEELRLAQNALSSITGQFSADDLLGEIFSSFCIGK